MKKLIISLLFILVLSCGPGKLLTWEKIGYGDVMVEEIKDIGPAQFEVICQNDTIPQNLDLWERTWFKDYETGETIYQYGYMKRGDTVYILIQTSGSWTITKRTIKP